MAPNVCRLEARLEQPVRGALLVEGKLLETTPQRCVVVLVRRVARQERADGEVWPPDAARDTVRDIGPPAFDPAPAAFGMSARGGDRATAQATPQSDCAHTVANGCGMVIAVGSVAVERCGLPVACRASASHEV